MKNGIRSQDVSYLCQYPPSLMKRGNDVDKNTSWKVLSRKLKINGYWHRLKSIPLAMKVYYSAHQIVLPG